MEYIVTEVNYHRNGVTGEGFYACRINDPENGEMIAVAFESSVSEQEEAGKGWINPRVAVFSAERLPATVRFMENSWRGDHYWPAIYEAIKEMA